MRIFGISLLAGAAIASSKVHKVPEARKQAIEARRRAANGSCANVKLRCRKGKGMPSSFSTGCNCHSVYLNKAGKGEVLAKCILKDPEIANGAVYESGAQGLCREQMPPCHKRTPEDLFGHCGSLPFDPETCFMDCKGPSCMPNYNASKCMKRPDVCKAFKNETVKCNKYKRYTESAYSHKACCRKCYRKTEDTPCLLGYLPKNADKKQGSQGVATWSAEDRDMKDAKTKLCCRIKKATLAKIKADGNLEGPPVFGPTPNGRIEESLCYGVRCGPNGDCNPVNGQCVCHNGWFTQNNDPCSRYNACWNETCHGNGNCTNTNVAAVEPGNCVCFTGWFNFQNKCDRYNPCVTTNCNNRGTCWNTNNAVNHPNTVAPQCNCNAGYAGNVCQTILNPCVSNPNYCNGGGSCQNLGGGNAKCNCVNGRFGDRCELTVRDIMEENMQNCPAALGAFMRDRYNHSICQTQVQCYPKPAAELLDLPLAREYRMFYMGADSKWFIFSNAYGYDHDAAKQACINLGGVLGSIKSQAQQNFVEYIAREGFITYDRNYRIGSQRRNIHFMGGRSHPDNMDWVWQDGSAVTWNNWNYGEPNNAINNTKSPPNEPYTEMYSSSYKWNDIYKDNGAFYHLCTMECP